MNRDTLKDRLTFLEGMSDSKLSEPSNMPVAIFLREAEAMIAAGRRDLTAFQKVGYAAERLDELDLRVDALRKAESLWRTARLVGSELRRHWDRSAAEGFRLHDELRAALLFVLRGDKDMVALVREVGRGQTAGELVQALSNLAVIADVHRTALGGINFDMPLIEGAAAMADELGRLLGLLDAENAGGNREVRLRNAAFTHLKEGLKELREYALYVFRRDKVKQRDYTSDYLRKKRIRRKKRAAQVAVPATKEVKDVVSRDRMIDPVALEKIEGQMGAFAQGKSEQKLCGEAPEHDVRGPEVGRRCKNESVMSGEQCNELPKLSAGKAEQCMNIVKVRTDTLDQRRVNVKVRTGGPDQCRGSVKVRREASEPGMHIAKVRSEGLKQRTESFELSSEGLKTWHESSRNEYRSAKRGYK